MSEIDVAEPYDQYLNCQQLVYAINKAEFGLKNVAERCARPHVFAKFVGCTAEVKRDAAKNEYILWDRIDYLKTLYKLKKCSLGMISVPISEQAVNIGRFGSGITSSPGNALPSATDSTISPQSDDAGSVTGVKGMDSLKCKNCKAVNSSLPTN